MAVGSVPQARHATFVALSKSAVGTVMVHRHQPQYLPAAVGVSGGCVTLPSSTKCQDLPPSNAVGASRRWRRVCGALASRRGAAWMCVTGAGREGQCRHVGVLPRESVCERGDRVCRARGVGTAAARHFWRRRRRNRVVARGCKLESHHGRVLRAFARAFAHRRACRLSDSYRGDPFALLRLLCVAWRRGQFAEAICLLTSKSSFWAPRDPVIGYSHTNGRVGPIFLVCNPHPEESWRRRGRPANSISPKRAHARAAEKFDDSSAVPHVSAYQLHPPAASTTTSKASSAAPARTFAAATAALRQRPRAAPTRAGRRQRAPGDV